ncbi:MAG: hypothetical protein ACYDA2_08020 [Acidimicrobiales bacterium]
MERLLVVWCPDLVEEAEDGRAARALARVVGAAAAFSPAARAVRPGVCAVPTRGPSRYFGGDEALAYRLLEALAEVTGTEPAAGPPLARVGIADGLFAAGLAARAADPDPVVVPPGASRAFLAPMALEVLERPELADLLWRLGIRTLGQLAALPTRHVLARLGNEGARCQALARAEDDRAPWLVSAHRLPGEEHDDDGAVGHRQPGFWGQSAAAEARAARAVGQVTALLGPEAVLMGRLQGGRGPAERARLVPWPSRRARPEGSVDDAPWPGRVPSPAPVVVLERPLPAALVDDGAAPVMVSAGGLCSSAPARLSVDGGPYQAVAAWAGPWPVDERWWTGRRRRRARLQLVTDGGDALLLVRERGGWWVEGAYD